MKKLFPLLILFVTLLSSCNKNPLENTVWVYQREYSFSADQIKEIHTYTFGKSTVVSERENYVNGKLVNDTTPYILNYEYNPPYVIFDQTGIEEKNEDLLIKIDGEKMIFTYDRDLPPVVFIKQ